MIKRRWMDTKEAGNSCTIGSESESVNGSGATGNRPGNLTLVSGNKSTEQMAMVEKAARHERAAGGRAWIPQEQKQDQPDSRWQEKSWSVATIE